jgi:RNA polymerase sigma-70 factor (ECF subfamily)
VPADQRRERIETLFRTYARGVGGYVLARVGNAELAEAITSRVFLIVVRSIEQCKTSPASWLWSIVRSELARHFRDRKDHAALDESLPDPAAEPPERASQREMQARTREALARLSEEHQRLVYMKFFQGMANKEIAAATGLTASNVGVLIHRALKQLRGYLAPTQAVEERA